MTKLPKITSMFTEFLVKIFKIPKHWEKYKILIKNYPRQTWKQPSPTRPILSSETFF